MMTSDDYQLNSTELRWGSRFKAAREASNLTQKDVAARLHLRSEIIAIIESEAFEKGPPAIFMRGYLRSYGRLLNFTETDIDYALNQLALKTSVSPIVPAAMTKPKRTHDYYMHWMTLGIIILLAGLVGTWWTTHGRYSQTMLSDNAPKPLETTATIQPSVSTQPTPTAVTIPYALTKTQTTSEKPSLPQSNTPSLQTSPPVAQSTTAAQPAPTQKPVSVSHLKMALPEQGLDSEDQ